MVYKYGDKIKYKTNNKIEMFVKHAYPPLYNYNKGLVYRELKCERNIIYQLLST